MFFYMFIFLFILLIETLLISTLKIEIKNIKLSTEKNKGKLFEDEYKITISLWGLRKIRFVNIEITQDKIETFKIKDKIKANLSKIDLEKLKEKKNINYKTLKKVKKYTPKIDYIDLIVNIGTEDAILTSYTVAIVATIIGLLLRKQMTNSKENRIIINPLYINKNLLNLELNCIIETKLIHIIYIIYILNQKRRDDKNVRTSNRRTYGYSYE